ncbi:MAG: BON domain-containing protein [Chitinophagaceae bacterium]|nr:BON domain-containing protein [Chitinophagaceae bacterium]
MKSDIQIQQDVMDQLKWDPLLNSARIGVAVKNGVVTLSGSVDTYYKKIKAEDAVKKVSGVLALAESLQVGLSPLYQKSDSDIAESVLSALKQHTSIPDENIKVKVEDGIVTLEGLVDWNYQRKIAEQALEGLAGVRGIVDNLIIKSVASSENIKKRIKEAFHRQATLDASRLSVETVGTKAILKGSVRSFAEKEDAESAAWSSPGVFEIDNRISVEAPEYSYEE